MDTNITKKNPSKIILLSELLNKNCSAQSMCHLYNVFPARYLSHLYQGTLFYDFFNMHLDNRKRRSLCRSISIFPTAIQAK